MQTRAKPSYDKDGETLKDPKVKSLAGDVEQRGCWQKQAWRCFEVTAYPFSPPLPNPPSSRLIFVSLPTHTWWVPREEGFLAMHS